MCLYDACVCTCICTCIYVRRSGSFSPARKLCLPPRTTANNKHWTNRSALRRRRRCRLVSWISLPVPISSRTLRRPLRDPFLDPSVPLFSLLFPLFACVPPQPGSNQSITPARLSTHIFDCSANMSKFILRPPIPIPFTPTGRRRSANARCLRQCTGER